MELYLTTPVSRPPSLEWHPHTMQHILRAKARGKAISSGRYAKWCMGAIKGKEGRIQVLAGIAPSIQTVGSNKRVIHDLLMNDRSEQHSHPGNKAGWGGKELARWPPSSKAGWGGTGASWMKCVFWLTIGRSKWSVSQHAPLCINIYLSDKMYCRS